MFSSMTSQHLTCIAATLEKPRNSRNGASLNRRPSVRPSVWPLYNPPAAAARSRCLNRLGRPSFGVGGGGGGAVFTASIRKQVRKQPTDGLAFSADIDD